ncbi:hypothetical protein FB451DRAFT_1404287 [Mycena latifolia]|nr:hypothetical protein FB451DRAFT_1404287 [Mycena latifolia]
MPSPVSRRQPTSSVLSQHIRLMCMNVHEPKLEYLYLKISIGAMNQTCSSLRAGGSAFARISKAMTWVAEDQPIPRSLTSCIVPQDGHQPRHQLR